MTFIKRNNDFSREVLKFIKLSGGFNREVLKFIKGIIKSIGFMTHGQLEACILRGSFSEIELPLSYNAHSRECADSRIQLIGYEINLLNKV